MEKTSYQEKEVSTSNTKGAVQPRRKDTAPKVNPQLAVELIFQEIKRIEAFTKRIEDATQRKVQIDEKSLENAENSLKSVLSGFEKQSYRMKNGGYVDKRISLWTILCAVFSLLFACLMCYLWVDAAKDRDNYKMYYEYYQKKIIPKAEILSLFFPTRKEMMIPKNQAQYEFYLASEILQDSFVEID